MEIEEGVSRRAREAAERLHEAAHGDKFPLRLCTDDGCRSLDMLLHVVAVHRCGY